MQAIAGVLAARLKEPSSWAGIGAILSAAGYVLPPDLGQPLVYVGMGVAGIVAFFLPEARNTGIVPPGAAK